MSPTLWLAAKIVVLVLVLCAAVVLRRDAHSLAGLVKGRDRDPKNPEQ